MNAFVLSIVFAISGGDVQPYTNSPAYSEQQVASLKESASTGDSNSSLALYEYFLGFNEIEEASFWLKLSAEQGSCEGMQEYGRFLGGALGKKEKGSEWLHKATEFNCSERK